MKEAVLKKTVQVAIGNNAIRSVLKSIIIGEIKRKLYGLKRETLPAFIEKRFQWQSALIERISANLDKGYIKKEVMAKAIRSFTGSVFSVDRTERLSQAQETYKDKFGDYPPLFVTLSPTQACNLQCVGCYASSDHKKNSFLPYDMVKRVVSDMRDNLSSNFITISGGEPFMYKDQGKTLLDLFSEFSDMFFMVYTNGTLLNHKLCENLAKLGNVSPAISIEGWEKETDERRGKGTFRKIEEGVTNLKKAGIPFGFSTTVTSKNVYTFLVEEIYDYLFERLNASYMWMFHMMPVGKARDTLPLIINSKQRLELYRKWEHLIYQKKYCIADFWNSGSVVDGCIGYGRWNGYFYIDWDGKIMPCVFVPFYEETVFDIYDSGRSLGDALQAPLFKNGREWQKEYGYCNCKKENILMPCSIRDHFENFKNNILSPGAKPENLEARQMLEDPAIEALLVRFEKDLHRLTERIWIEEYCQVEDSAVPG
jgi:MoaA/NifB/PqqE/SkfB family radical SAM enzyme